MLKVIHTCNQIHIYKTIEKGKQKPQDSLDWSTRVAAPTKSSALTAEQELALKHLLFVKFYSSTTG